MRYVLAVMANDPSRVVRRHVARCACQSLALLVSMGEMKNALKDSESLLIEEDGSMPPQVKEAKKSDVDLMIKVLRKDREIGKNEVLREFMMPIVLYVISSSCAIDVLDQNINVSAPDVDHEVRWGVIKLADIVLRGVEETPPKVTIHLPPTPVSEQVPQLPLGRVPAKPQRPIKTGGPPQRPHAVPATPAPAKLKIMPSAARPSTPSATTPAAVSRAGAMAPPPVPTKAKPKPKPKPAGITKAPHVLKAQTGGMSVNDLRACRNALKKLKLHKNATLFMQPVDPVRDHAPKFVFPFWLSIVL